MGIKNKLYYQENPIQWIHDALDDKPRWEKQVEILNSVRDYRRTYVKSCHGIGKTYTAKDCALWFLYNFSPSIVITTAPSWPQVQHILWAEINNAFKNTKWPLGGKCFDVKLDIKDNWYAIGLSPKIESTDEGKRFTGFHSQNILIILDEAPSVNGKVWEIINSLMTSENAKLLAIGNPISDHGYFFDGFRDKSVNKISMDIFDSPNFKANNIKNLDDLIKLNNLNLNELESVLSEFKNPFPALTTVRWAIDMINRWGIDSPLFESRVLAKFPKAQTDTLISLTALEECKMVDKLEQSKKILGVDVARFGTDDTVFIGYENYRQIYKEKWNGQDTYKTTNRIKHLISNSGFEIIVIDDTGLGGGITDSLNDWLRERKNVRLIPINFAQKSNIPEYEGIITEMWYNAKDMIKNKLIQVEDSDNLFAELTNRKYKFTSNGTIRIESKDEYKKRVKTKSPDEADAFILCCYGMMLEKMDNRIESFGKRTMTNESNDTEDYENSRIITKMDW